MTNHLELPSSLLSFIQEFVGTHKPVPVLIFEKGDLFVEFVWNPDHHGQWFSNTFVARPCHVVDSGKEGGKMSTGLKK
jgi:hypothetical protein